MGRAILARGLACGALIAVVLSIAKAAGAQPRTASRVPLRSGLAAYDWHNALELSPAETRRRLQFLNANGFRTVYLDLGDYLDVVDQPVSEAQQARLRQLKQALRRYVATASSYGLAVHAVGGGPDWTHEERRYLGARVVQLVAEYNLGVRATERLGGVQLDIEPYLDPAFFADEQASLTAFLVTLQGIVDTYRPLRTDPANHRLQLGFVLLFWFDGDDGAPGPVLFNGATKPATYHTIDMVADLPTAYVLLMSYRNVAPGTDGSIYHVRREFGYVRGVGAACGLVVGQEYANSAPPKITFYGHPRRTFQKAANRSVSPSVTTRSSAGCPSTTSTPTWPPGSSRAPPRQPAGAAVSSGDHDLLAPGVLCLAAPVGLLPGGWGRMEVPGNGAWHNAGAILGGRLSP